ncbi:hypothetical protein HBB16_05675 [Pseudonocardia sp. MCCB 268]|nr:hypothetical protein [Pseudonocardia cytotoxica]
MLSIPFVVVCLTLAMRKPHRRRSRWSPSRYRCRTTGQLPTSTDVPG